MSEFAGVVLLYVLLPTWYRIPHSVLAINHYVRIRRSLRPAHQQCCSSKKKYNHDKNFCEFYAFDEPEINDNVEISEGIAFDAEDSTEGGIDCTMCQDEKCDADEAALDVIKE